MGALERGNPVIGAAVSNEGNEKIEIRGTVGALK